MEIRRVVFPQDDKPAVWVAVYIKSSPFVLEKWNEN
jgi:hypothetical protein